MKNITKWISYGLMILGILCFIGLFVLSAYYMSHRPTVPNVKFGYVCAFNQHGWIVYLGKDEHLVMYYLPWVSALLVFSGAAVRANSSWNPGNRRK